MAVALRLPDALGEPEPEPEPVAELADEADADPDRAAVADGAADWEPDRLADRLPLGDALGERLPGGEALAEAAGEGAAEALDEGEGAAASLAPALRVALREGATSSEARGEAEARAHVVPQRHAGTLREKEARMGDGENGRWQAGARALDAGGLVQQRA